MNENLDLVEILKDCPIGMKLYSPLCGEVVLNSVDEYCRDYPIEVNCDSLQLAFTRDGRKHRKLNGECMLYPSKDQRDWSKFKVPAEKFDYSTLKPYDKVLVRDRDDSFWKCNLLSHRYCSIVYCIGSYWNQMIPYNDDTKHLVGTTDRPDEKYIWWEE